MATFIVNIAGCFLIGLLVSMVEKQAWADNNFRYLFITGFCGGFTTFSAFAHENVSLLNSQQSFIAFAYIAASVVAGLLAVWLGMAAGRAFINSLHEIPFLPHKLVLLIKVLLK